MEDACQSFVLAASEIENEAINLDRRGDVKGAIEKYEESQSLLQRAIGHATAAHAADRPKLEQHRREILDRIQHLKSLKRSPSNIPVEDQIRAVQLGMQATTAASQATSAAGGVKQMAAVAAVGAVGGAVVLGSALGLATVGAVGGAAAAGVAATRSDQVGDVARGVGAMAIKGYDKAREINREHDISGKVMEAGSKAVTTAGVINEKYGITDKVCKGVHAAVAKAQEVEEKHHVSSKVASGIAFGFSKAAEGFDKLTEAASGRRTSQITDSAGGRGVQTGPGPPRSKAAMAYKLMPLLRRLEPISWKRDVLMLDVAMEEQLRTLAERSDVAAMPRDDLLTFIFLILEDLMLSRHDPSLQQGYGLLQKLMQQGSKWSPEWCKMLHAAFDRLALTCTATADCISTALQDCADQLLQAGSKPGAVFSPEEKHLGTFGEEKARCLTERVLAQTLKVFMPQVRRLSGLGPWEVVASGSLGGAVGVVQPVAQLPSEAPAEAQVLLVETMTGWEDIPANIHAILLPAGQAVDTLSHVAIRARNQEVLLASCDEDQQLQQLRQMKGQNLRLQVSATGEVTWQATSEKSKLKNSTAAAFLAETMKPPPAPPTQVLPATDFTKHQKSIGGKSLHLAELMVDGTYSVPVSATIPYGMFEQVLKDKANEGIEEELQEVLEEGDLNEARNFLEEELAVPSSLRGALDAALGADAKALDAGDWQRALKKVWASKWTDRAVASRKQMKVPDKALYLAVLVQPVVHAQYAFVIHTRSPLPGASPDAALVELCVGLGESLVSNAPGRALSASVEGQAINVHVYPSKPEGVFVPEGGTAIFRSDSNGEDLEGFAGAGLYDSVTVKECEHRSIDYAEEPLFFDVQFRSQLLLKLFQIGRQIEKNFSGQAQDIEGAVTADGKIVITQSRPQV